MTSIILSLKALYIALFNFNLTEMTTYTTITITQKGKTHPTFTFGRNRRMTEEEIHDIVVSDGLIGLDPNNVDVHVFFETKES